MEQFLQLFAPFESMYRPDGQGKHSPRKLPPLPCDNPYRPKPHFVQLVAPSFFDSSPKIQVSHFVASTLLLFRYRPILQSLQFCPIKAYLPASQRTHLILPAMEYIPLGQVEHLIALDLGLYVFA